VCVFRGSDAGWVSAVKREMFGKVSGIRDDAIPSSDTFVVKHFAADVVYKAENFVARNNDALHHDLAQLPKASGSALLLALFAKDNEVSAPSTPSVDDAVSAASSPHGFGPKMPQLTSQGSSGGLSSPSTAGGTPSGPSDTGIVRGGQHKLATLDTVSSRFTQQLDAMMSELAATSPQFIRCVKSNARQVPNEFDSTLVLHQLRYLGVLDAIRVRKVGYPVRREFEELVRDYIELTGNKTAARRRLKAKKGPKVIAADICQKGTLG
jgi:myosin heavy subunit